MESNIRFCVGIDVDKSSFKASLNACENNKVKVKASRTFNNGQEGFAALLDWSAKHIKNDQFSICFVMEATGVYHEHLAYFLYQKGKQVHIILPTKAKRYLQSLGYRSKNDKIDAQGLAVMGLQQTFKAWQPCSTQIYTLRSLTRQLEALQNSKTVFNNELEAATYSAFSSEIVTKSLQSLIGSVEEQIRFAKKEIERIITDDPVFSAKYKLIEPIKGMGLITFATIVAETGGFELFNSRSQLVCYAGYDVIENQSGKRVGKTRISKKGNTHIRRIMHMASLNMVRYKEPVFSGLYERVFDRTKIKMKAYVAVQRKLLCLFYTLWKNNTVYEPDYLESKEKALLLET